MSFKGNASLLLVVIFAVLWGSSMQIAIASGTIADVEVVGTWLYDNQNQIIGSIGEGSWNGYGEETGSIVIGLVEAYLRTCDEDFKQAALLGGEYIWRQNDVSPIVYLGFGDDALAFARLSSISPDPQDNKWRTELEQFYLYVKQGVSPPPVGYGSTSGFITHFTVGTAPSTAVYYLAHHAIAADYAGATDKNIWRNAVIAFLSQVDDLYDANAGDYHYPVLSLGIATWALAQTGELDSTAVGIGLGEPRWDSVTLADLPDLLLEHSDSNTGSFYWRFDHTDGAGNWDGDTNGFTEDNIFGVLGLAAALEDDPDRSNAAQIAERIADTKWLLPYGIDIDGSVWGHLWLGSPKHTFYAGEMLTALSGITVDGDLNMDGVFDMKDLFIFAQYWLVDCDCVAELNGDGIVNFIDFAMGLAKNWD